MAVTIQNYNQFLEILGDGTLDMDTHSFKLALMTSGFTFTPTHTLWAQVSATNYWRPYTYWCYLESDIWHSRI